MDILHLRYLIAEKLILYRSLGKILKYCISKNNFNIINFLLTEKGVDLKNILQYALTLGNLEAIKWIHQQDPALTLLDLPSIHEEIGPPELLTEAGHIDILQYLHKTGMYIFDKADVKALAIAQSEGHLDIVQWLSEDIGISIKNIDGWYN